MERSDITDHPGGQAVRHRTGYWFYSPAPMSAELPLDADTTMLLSRADAIVGELSGVGRLLPNPHLLIYPYERREALSSSRIEGTQADFSGLLFDETTPVSASTDLLEVRNYVRAMTQGIELLRTRPIASRLVLELHHTLMRDVIEQERTPGEFRRSQNWIGPAGTSPMNAPYVPPPPELPPELLSDWERFVNTSGRMPDLVRCALMHERFETIHPFLDGNGRVGRLLITMFLLQRRRLTLPLLYLSAAIERTKSDYGKSLQRVRTHNDRLGWVRYFLSAVIEAGSEAIHQADALLALRAELRAKYEGQPRAQAVVEVLMTNPLISIPRLAQTIKASKPTVSRLVDQLVSDGLLREVTQRSWGRMFISDRIVAALEKSPPVVESPPIG